MLCTFYIKSHIRQAIEKELKYIRKVALSDERSTSNKTDNR